MINKGSILNNYDAVLKAASNSSSIKDALILLQLRPAGGNYKAFKSACQRFEISIPDFDRASQLQSIRQDKIPNVEVFVENSSYNNRNALKKRLIEIGFEYVCSECSCLPVWNDKPLTIQLDHINGIWNDNRIENLRFLCPNCHSQTETFCGKAKPKAVKIPKQRPTKINWPDFESLQEMVSTNGYSKTGKTLGVSDNAVRKRLNNS